MTAAEAFRLGMAKGAATGALLSLPVAILLAAAGYNLEIVGTVINSGILAGVTSLCLR